MKGWTVLALIAVLLVACAGDGSGGSNSEAPSSVPAGVPLPADTPAPPRMGPDGPEPPDVEGLVAYGNQHRDTFGGLYLDPPGGSRVVMLFTADLEAHQRAVNDILPGTQVRQARFTEAALTALLESLDFDALAADGIEMVGAGLDTIGNRVTLEVKSNDPTAEVRLELPHGGMLDVTVFPLPGAWVHETEGDGWRLLAIGRAGSSEGYTVRAATDDAEWDELWAALDLDVERPNPDLETEVVVSFAHAFGSSCPEVRLDGVEIDGDLVYSLASDPLAPRACTADLAGAATFVVALERDALPADGFTLRLGAQRITCAECGFSEEIDVPLP